MDVCDEDCYQHAITTRNSFDSEWIKNSPLNAPRQKHIDQIYCNISALSKGGRCRRHHKPNKMIQGKRMSSVKMFACPVIGCCTFYRKFSELKEHLRNGHEIHAKLSKTSKLRREYLCNYCSTPYRTLHDLLMHTKTHEAQRSRRVTSPTPNASTGSLPSNHYVLAYADSNEVQMLNTIYLNLGIERSELQVYKHPTGHQDTPNVTVSSCRSAPFHSTPPTTNYN